MEGFDLVDRASRGLGVGSVTTLLQRPKIWASSKPLDMIDIRVVEIDPNVAVLAKKYFHFPATSYYRALGTYKLQYQS